MQTGVRVHYAAKWAQQWVFEKWMGEGVHPSTWESRKVMHESAAYDYFLLLYLRLLAKDADMAMAKATTTEDKQRAQRSWKDWRSDRRQRAERVKMEHWAEQWQELLRKAAKHQEEEKNAELKKEAQLTVERKSAALRASKREKKVMKTELVMIQRDVQRKTTELTSMEVEAQKKLAAAEEKVRKAKQEVKVAKSTTRLLED